MSLFPHFLWRRSVQVVPTTIAVLVHLRISTTRRVEVPISFVVFCLLTLTHLLQFAVAQLFPPSTACLEFYLLASCSKSSTGRRSGWRCGGVTLWCAILLAYQPLPVSSVPARSQSTLIVNAWKLGPLTQFTPKFNNLHHMRQFQTLNFFQADSLVSQIHDNFESPFISCIAGFME